MKKFEVVFYVSSDETRPRTTTIIETTDDCSEVDLMNEILEAEFYGIPKPNQKGYRFINLKKCSEIIISEVKQNA